MVYMNFWVGVKTLVFDVERHAHTHTRTHVYTTGVAFTVVVFLAACYEIAETRYAAAAGETFWCDLAG